jgi:serine/threonine-protein kinase RsbT
MSIAHSEERPIRSPEDVVLVRQVVRTKSIEHGFGLVDQTKLVTAASELARNTLTYGGGGVMLLELLNDGARKGVRLTFSDEGPGIPDIDRAMRDGFTTGGGLGLGLGGSKRLSNEFTIASEPGKGTRITITRWR